MPFYHARRTIRKAPGAVIKAVPLPEPKLVQGFGSRDQAGSICEQAGYSHALVATDKTLHRLGLHEKVLASLDAQGVAHTLFYDIDSEPTEQIVTAGRKAALECGADCVIALGGGSVLDSSKVIAIGAAHPSAPIGRFLHKFAYARNGTLPMVNIPSTAGTGAECTVGTVVTNGRGAKCSTVIVGLEIEAVVLDGELLIDAPRSVTTWCAIDALSHGLEGLLADVNSTDEDLFKSWECVRLALENLPILLDDPRDVDARQATLLAAHYGGNAINTQLAGYVHAFAHSIGALYHIPHGKAIAWCLVPVMQAQQSMRYAEMAGLAKYCGLAGADDSREVASDKLILALKDLLERCGLERGCDLLHERDYDQLVGMIDFDAVNYSPPRTFSDHEIRMLLDQIRRGY